MVARPTNRATDRATDQTDAHMGFMGKLHFQYCGGYVADICG